MPLVFLLTYVFLTYFIYKKNKDNKENISLVVKLNWIIAFGLLFVFIVYYSGNNYYDLNKIFYAYSFYFLLISYIIIFVYHMIKYRMIIEEKKIKLDNVSVKWEIEKSLDNFYFFLVILFSFIYFLYSRPIEFYWSNQVDLFIYIVILLSTLYLFFEKKILYSLK